MEAPKARILVVEDEMIVARSLQKRLQGTGYEVPVMAASGEEALQQIERVRPDLVLMDIMLSGKVDGIEAARHIRDHFEIPVIFLTAYADNPTLERAKESQPYGYVLKPFYISELLTSIEIALHRHRFEQELARQKRWFSAALRSIGDAVIATDAQGRIRFMNAVAETMTGWRSAEVLGRDLMEVLRLKDPAGQLDVEALWQIVQGAASSALPPHLLLQPHHGDPIPVGMTASSISTGGEMDGHIVVLRDLSLQHAQEQTLDLARQRAEDVAQLKETLLHTLTHEIRAPLTNILGYASMIAEDDDSRRERYREFARIILDSGEQLEEKVNTVLEWTRLHSSREALPRAPVNMLECAQSVVEEARSEAGERGLSLHLEAQKPLPVIQSDPASLYRILSILVHNAMRWTPEGEVRLHVWHEPSHLYLSVEDTGPDIPDEDRDHIFHPFQQVPASRPGPPEDPGRGLDLAIASELAQALGGTLRLESASGTGNRFVLSLPRS